MLNQHTLCSSCIGWIPETNHTLPPNASHRVGVASFVVNNNGQVKEEVEVCVVDFKHIDTEFMEVLAFRLEVQQSHKSFFSKSDLMFVCMLKPTSLDIEKQDSEIEAAHVIIWPDNKV
ncbi:putative hydrolase [Helianthus anomalus]